MKDVRSLEIFRHWASKHAVDDVQTKQTFFTNKRCNYGKKEKGKIVFFVNFAEETFAD